MATRHRTGCGVYWLTIGLALLLAIFISAASTDAQQAPAAKKDNLYDSNPNHLWNRLHRALFIRTDRDGTEYGFDELDPLLWWRSNYLLEGERLEQAKRVLDEFISDRGEKLINDPVKRAILQRDLWAVFDWTAEQQWSPETQEARRALQTRLATVISRIALTKAQIKSLPDNYGKAVKSHRYPAEFNAKKPDTPFLPTDLFSTNGGWVCIGLNGSESIAPVHRYHFGGRSVFLIFMHMPPTRQETSNYLHLWVNTIRIYQYSETIRKALEQIVRKQCPPRFEPVMDERSVQAVIRCKFSGDLKKFTTYFLPLYEELIGSLHPYLMPIIDSFTYSLTPEEREEVIASRKKIYLGPRKRLTPEEIRMYSRSIPPSWRTELLEKAKFRCCHCGTKVNRSTAHMDHIIPFSKGGLPVYICPTTDWKYFYATLDVELLDSDDDEDGAIGLQPRYLIFDKVFELFRHFQVHPVLQPSVGRIVGSKIRLFDGHSRNQR